MLPPLSLPLGKRIYHLNFLVQWNKKVLLCIFCIKRPSCDKSHLVSSRVECRRAFLYQIANSVFTGRLMVHTPIILCLANFFIGEPCNHVCFFHAVTEPYRKPRVARQDSPEN